MKEYKIKFSKEAREDLTGIVGYIKNNLQEENIAIRIYQKIKQKIEALKYNPSIYPIIEDYMIKKLNVRKVVSGNYIIFYTVFEEKLEIYVIRIMYARRNWIEML